MGYSNLAFRGISWMAALRAVTRALAIVKTAILARLLVPAQFGIYGVATLVLGFLEVMTETGINVFLIQEKDKIDDYLDSAWVVSILRGIIIASLVLILTPLIIVLFNSPESRQILVLTSLVPFIRGFINPAAVKFQKNLEFNKQFFYDSSLFLIDTIVAIGLGILTKSENSLIWGMIVAALFEVVISFIVFSPKPKFGFEREKVRKVIDRGKWITGAGIFNYLFQSIDDILVGRILGTTPLGLYQQSYRISSLPVTEVGEVFNKVTFPIYSTIQNEKLRLKQAFNKTLLMIITFVVPFGLFVFFFPELIIKVFLGENWLEAVSILKILAIFGILKAISNSFFSLFLALKKQEVVTLITFVSILGLVTSIYPLMKVYGINGAAISTIVATLVSFPFTIYQYNKIFK